MTPFLYAAVIALLLLCVALGARLAARKRMAALEQAASLAADEPLYSAIADATNQSVELLCAIDKAVDELESVRSNLDSLRAQAVNEYVRRHPEKARMLRRMHKRCSDTGTAWLGDVR